MKGLASTLVSDLHPTAQAFRECVERGDHAAAAQLLAEDVTFNSPIVHRTYLGRDSVAPVLAGVVAVFEDFRYTAQYASAPDGDGVAGAVLAFSCRVGDRNLDGVDIFRIDADGEVVEFTVMVRPYSAATALRERMAALLA